MANVDEELRGFVREALARGVSRAEAEGVLLKAGWPSEQVRAALATFGDFDFPILLPQAKAIPFRTRGVPLPNAIRSAVFDSVQPWQSTL